MYLPARVSNLTLPLALVCSMLVASAGAGTTKDIVLDRVNPAIQAPPAMASSDAMAVSVLVESPDGSLSPRSTQTLFRTGERLRIKVIASRAGKLSLYNTNPLGVTGKEPVWSGMVAVGQETISPRLVLTGNTGEDLLHVLIEPTEAVPQGTWGWLNGLLASKGTSKDIRLDVENTASASYVVNPAGQGLLTTVRIVHSR